MGIVGWFGRRRAAARRRPSPSQAAGTDPGAPTTVLTVNGRAHELRVDPGASLLSVLRDELGLRGTKEACGRGECGSCTVLVGDRAVMSCLELAVRVGEPVTTVEEVARRHPEIGEAFADCGGYQCGFCTPGQVVRAAELLAAGLPDDDASLRRMLSGNVCRCTGYQQIIDAVRSAARSRGATR